MGGGGCVCKLTLFWWQSHHRRMNGTRNGMESKMDLSEWNDGMNGDGQRKEELDGTEWNGMNGGNWKIQSEGIMEWNDQPQNGTEWINRKKCNFDYVFSKIVLDFTGRL